MGVFVFMLRIDKKMNYFTYSTIAFDHACVVFKKEECYYYIMVLIINIFKKKLRYVWFTTSPYKIKGKINLVKNIII